MQQLAHLAYHYGTVLLKWHFIWRPESLAFIAFNTADFEFSHHVHHKANRA